MHSVKGRKKREEKREWTEKQKLSGRMRDRERRQTRTGRNGAATGGVGGLNRGENRRSGKFSTRKKSESRPALVSIAGCAVSLTFPLFVKRSAGRVLFAFK